MYHERIEQLALLAQPFDTFTKETFYAYIISLRNEDFKKKATTKRTYKVVSIGKNKKGTYIVRCRRRPKAVTRSEIDYLSKEIGESYLTTWNLFKDRNIAISETIIDDIQIEKAIKGLPY